MQRHRQRRASGSDAGGVVEQQLVGGRMAAHGLVFRSNAPRSRPSARRMRDFTVPKRQLQLLGDGGMGLVLEEGLADDHQLVGREAVQKFLHPRVRLPGQDGFVGIVVFGRKNRQPVLGVDRRPAAAAQQVDPLVAGDGVDPGCGGSAAAVEARGLAPHHDQRFLATSCAVSASAPPFMMKAFTRGA